MRCSICAGGGEVKERPFSCTHNITLCSKCSLKMSANAQCTECQHMLFAELDAEINKAATKEQELTPPTPEKKTEVRTNTMPAMRSNKPMVRFACDEGEVRCDGCGFYFCDCTRHYQSRII